MELADNTVVERFEEVADNSLRDRKERLLAEFRSNGMRSEVASAVQENIRQSKRKDSMLTLLLNAFVPRGNPSGILSERINWEYRAFSLQIPDAPLDADFAIFDLDDYGVGLLVCLTDPASMIETLEDIERLATTAERNTSEIERQLSSTGRTSIDTDEIFTVLSVPQTDLEQIDDNFSNADIQEARDSSWIWELSITSEQKISVFTGLGTSHSDSMSFSGDLDRELSTPVAIERQQSEVNPDLYPSSHQHSKASQLVRNLVSKRVMDDNPNTHFTKIEAVEYLTGQENLAHNANSDITQTDARSLLDWWESTGIIDSISPSQTSMSGANSYYRFTVDEQKSSGIISKVINRTEANIIDEEFEKYSMREALDETGYLDTT